ncbi:unnamed protein product [Rangifer tarandus platyrhynchus]|uniref:Uncharacterized protein n=1 Tax=Rangifer tarandus platyrhynchus TaxID=3082113 RepID=A0ABN8ZEF7_RANTA|nr:unnamed protein product [Rangifer tarandus platyrhynchus]
MPSLNDLEQVMAPPSPVRTPRAGLTQPCRRLPGKQVRAVRTLAASQRARLGHTPPEREEGAGREGGPRLPRRALPPPWGCHSHPAVQPTQGAGAGRPGRKERRQRGREPVPTLEAGPASRGAGSAPSHGGDLAQRAAPRARTALQWACREAARLHAGEPGCGCSSAYKEAAPIAGRSAAAGFQVPAAPEKLWTCTDFFFEPEFPLCLGTPPGEGVGGGGASLGSAGGARGGRPPGKAKVIPGGQGPPLGPLPAQATAQAS